ncbi:MAG: carboxypeptidase-like regulatory domain-containing protein [Candidatus Sericytochromatia bacterium]|nr:carboxypeptidase-like regulatory domain-containing protein [Candidatus Sericytochromatia bacterium]
MASDINPIRPSAGYTGNVPANDVVGFNTRGGNGRGGGRRNRNDDTEEEAPESDDQAPHRLNSDAFLGSQATSSLEQLFDDQLPWEKTDLGVDDELDAGDALLNQIKIPPPPGSPPVRPASAVMPNAKARRVDANYDSASAVHQTWQAQQELREKQLEKASEKEPPTPAPAEIGTLLRPDTTKRGEPHTPIKSPPSSSSTSLTPPLHPPDANTPRTATSHSETGFLPAPVAPRVPETIKAPLEQTGRTKSGEDFPGPTPAPSSALTLEEITSSFQEEGSAASPLDEQLERSNSSQTKKIADEPMTPGRSETLPGSCLYRVVDVNTDAPLARAQVEIDPVRDDFLPQFNGQTDDDGWFRQTGVPPGEYRVSVRARGYVPIYKVRIVEAGITDDVALFMAKP